MPGGRRPARPAPTSPRARGAGGRRGLQLSAPRTAAPVQEPDATRCETRGFQASKWPRHTCFVCHSSLHHRCHPRAFAVLTRNGRQGRGACRGTKSGWAKMLPQQTHRQMKRRGWARAPHPTPQRWHPPAPNCPWPGQSVGTLRIYKPTSRSRPYPGGRAFSASTCGAAQNGEQQAFCCRPRATLERQADERAARCAQGLSARSAVAWRSGTPKQCA